LQPGSMVRNGRDDNSARLQPVQPVPEFRNLRPSEAHVRGLVACRPLIVADYPTTITTRPP